MKQKLINISRVYLQVEARPFGQVSDLYVKLQPAVPQHFFIERFGSRPLLKDFTQGQT